MMECVPEEVGGRQGSGAGQAQKAGGTPLLRQEKGKRPRVGREACGWWKFSTDG